MHSKKAVMIINIMNREFNQRIIYVRNYVQKIMCSRNNIHSRHTKKTVRKYNQALCDSLILHSSCSCEKHMLLFLAVDVYHLGMSLNRLLAAPSTTVLSLAMSLVAARHAAT